MPEKTTCPKCHLKVRSTDYFCYNCGENLKPKPPSTSLSAQLTLYLKSVLVPPLGIVWAVPYLKQKSGKSKMVGLITIMLTVIVLTLAAIWINNFFNQLNTQINEQMNGFYY